MDVEALVSNQAIVTCLANDIGYEKIFSYQLEVKASSSDLLIVLSGGNSPNVVNALHAAKKLKLKSYALLGFDGGICNDLASEVIHFKIDDMLVCEDLQMITFVYVLNG